MSKENQENLCRHEFLERYFPFILKMLVEQDDVFKTVENNGCTLLDIQQNFLDFPEYFSGDG